MLGLDIASLVVALVALAFGVVALARAHSSEERADSSAKDAAVALERALTAEKAAADATHRAQLAVADAAQAMDGAASARQVAERAVQRADTASLELAAARKELTQRVSADPALARQPAVAWSLAAVKGSGWVVRNSGTATARSVLLSDATQPPKYVRPAEVIPRDVAPGDVLQFQASITRGGPPPRVRVIWRQDESEEPQTFDLTVIPAG